MVLCRNVSHCGLLVLKQEGRHSATRGDKGEPRVNDGVKLRRENNHYRAITILAIHFFIVLKEYNNNGMLILNTDFSQRAILQEKILDLTCNILHRGHCAYF